MLVKKTSCFSRFVSVNYTILVVTRVCEHIRTRCCALDIRCQQKQRWRQRTRHRNDKFITCARLNEIYVTMSVIKCVYRDVHRSHGRSSPSYIIIILITNRALYMFTRMYSALRTGLTLESILCTLVPYYMYVVHIMSMYNNTMKYIYVLCV